MAYLQSDSKKPRSRIMGGAGAQEKSRKNKGLGDRGEEIACSHLKGIGFRIVDRNIRYRSGEIDIVARRGDELHFVEVKTRSGRSCGSPLEGITEWKKRRMMSAARMYLADYRNKFNSANLPPCFFSVIGIDISDGVAAVECILDAFA
jgi:putative endonuclease